jgi:aspartyl-tRNA(Asn)/glutamyl-tRNA(Gln) amidotransferase subunit B
VQPKTESKAFSSSGTDFGLPPNTQTNSISLGLRGTLPVMKQKAFELALDTVIGLGGQIVPFTNVASFDS